LAGEFLKNERERDRDTVGGILGRLKRIRLRSRPVPGGLAGARVMSIHHGLQPGEVEFRLISSGVIHDMRSLLRPTRSEVREVLDAYREMRPVREKVRNESRENLLLAWVHQRYGDDAIAVLDGEGGNGRVFGRVWHRVRVLTRN
jgi:hypothetical protein